MKDTSPASVVAMPTLLRQAARALAFAVNPPPHQRGAHPHHAAATHHEPCRALPLNLLALEQHPNSSQVFVCLSADRFLVVVAPEAPDIGRVHAFIGRRINVRQGVWHAPIVALRTDWEFLMLIWEQDLPADCSIERLPVPLLVLS